MEDEDHTPGSDESEWAGKKLAEELINPRPKLKSTVVNREKSEVSPEGGAVVEIGSVIVQRDSGDRWEIVDIKDSSRGGKLVNLNNLDKNVRATLDFDDLKTKLSTEGSAWHW